MKILGISRGEKFSPNLASSDLAVFTAVADNLKQLGNEVDVIAESEMLSCDFTSYDRVYTMARDTYQLVLLEKDTDYPTQSKFINSIDGILTCTNKAAVASQLLDAGIPQPEFLVGQQKNIRFCSTDDKNDLNVPLWLKNCDGSAQSADDTVFCQTKEQFDSAFANMLNRNVGMWMVQQHLAGDLIKFYGVEGTNFFSWNYASEGHSKFGLEAINGKEQGFKFDPERVKLYADMIAKKLNVPVYGGDAIINEEGEFFFIDFNDFPSFSTCREEAAKAIAQRIIS